MKQLQSLITRYMVNPPKTNMDTQKWPYLKGVTILFWVRCKSLNFPLGDEICCLGWSVGGSFNNVRLGLSVGLTDGCGHSHPWAQYQKPLFGGWFKKEGWPAWQIRNHLKYGRVRIPMNHASQTILLP